MKIENPWIVLRVDRRKLGASNHAAPAKEYRTRSSLLHNAARFPNRRKAESHARKLRLEFPATISLFFVVKATKGDRWSKPARFPSQVQRHFEFARACQTRKISDQQS